MRYRAYSQDKGHTQVTGNSRSGCGRLFATATVMARRGRYADAIRLLEQARDADECSDAEVLDFHARIYAQQGLYLYAESCWRRAQSMDSSNPAYAHALERLRRDQRPTARLYRMAVLFGCLAVLALLIWQLALVNPLFNRRQDAADRLLSAIHADIEIIGGGVCYIMDSKLSERRQTTPTALGTAQDSNVIMRHVDETTSAMEKAIAE